VERKENQNQKGDSKKKRGRGGSEQVIEIVLEYLYASYKMSYVKFIKMRRVARAAWTHGIGARRAWYLVRGAGAMDASTVRGGQRRVCG